MTPGLEVRGVLHAALDRAVFTAVSAEIGDTETPLWQYAAGHLALDDSTPATTATVFDLASLTKVLATATLALTLESRGRLDLSRPVMTLSASWAAALDRRAVTVRDLLEHTSGLPAHRPYYRMMAGREAYEDAIAAEPLEYAPRSRSIYSDLGFILLGFLIADVGEQTLDAQFMAWRDALGIAGEIAFGSRPGWRARTAATEQDVWRGRLLRGEVHDENAAALGGIAGHAGLFGTAAAVGDIARWWLARLRGADDYRLGVSADRARAYVRKSVVPGSSRALGWDTMVPTSSCGSQWSEAAIGHTGFTGTSLWLDPMRDRYAVLLSNRVHPSRRGDRMNSVRRAFHDAVVADFA